MEIKTAYIVMESNHHFVKKYEKEESLTIRIGDNNPATQDTDTALPSVDSTNPIPSTEDPNAILGDDNLSLLKLLVESITGKKINLLDASVLNGEAKNVEMDTENVHSGQRPEGVGFGIVYNYHESYSEEENTSFVAQGVIKTTDNKEIKFNIQLNMNRSFKTEKNINIRAGDAAYTDPLVINFRGNSAELTNTKFAFDLDADGKEEDISFVKSGSGFLALDLNNDGVINNGSELFGPRTGNGFFELAEYDNDNNNFIDSNDAVYDRLSVLTKDQYGNDTLENLKQKGVTAIYLGSVSSEFNLTEDNNKSNGRIKSTGIYVNNNDSIGTVQQIDLVA